MNENEANQKNIKLTWGGGWGPTENAAECPKVPCGLSDGTLVPLWSDWSWIESNILLAPDVLSDLSEPCSFSIHHQKLNQEKSLKVSIKFWQLLTCISMCMGVWVCLSFKSVKLQNMTNILSESYKMASTLHQVKACLAISHRYFSLTHFCLSAHVVELQRQCIIKYDNRKPYNSHLILLIQATVIILWSFKFTLLSVPSLPFPTFEIPIDPRTAETICKKQKWKKTINMRHNSTNGQSNLLNLNYAFSTTIKKVSHPTDFWWSSIPLNRQTKSFNYNTWSYVSTVTTTCTWSRISCCKCLCLLIKTYKHINERKFFPRCRFCFVADNMNHLSKLKAITTHY